MSWAVGFVALLLLAIGAGVFGLWWAWLGLDVVRQLASLRPGAAAHLAEGPAALAGTAEADAPLPGGHGAPCSLVHVRFELSAAGCHTATPPQHSLYAPGAALRDATGRCPLGPGALLLCGPQRAWTVDPQEFRERFPHYVALIGGVPWSQGTITIIEETVEVGASILAAGWAVADPDEQPEGYRRGGAPRLRLTGHTDEKLLVAVGPRPIAVARALLPSALMVLVALATLGFTATLGYMAYLL